MNIEIKDLVLEIMRKQKNKARLEIIKEILGRLNIDYVVEEATDSKNIIVRLRTKQREYNLNKSITVIGAHYDVVPDSLGINDNTVAVAMLIKFLYDVLNNNLDITEDLDVVFFDKEEVGNIGARDYIKRYGSYIKEALLFDIIGYKDVILASGGMSKITKMFTEYDVKILRHMLPGDNIAFVANNIPVSLITSAAKEDITNNNDLTHSVVPNASFYKTFHNREWDNDISYINFQHVEKIYQMLKDLYSKI